MNNRNTRTIPILGGIAFPIIWIVRELLFSADPSLVRSIVGSSLACISWLLGTLYFGRQESGSGSMEQPCPPSSLQK